MTDSSSKIVCSIDLEHDDAVFRAQKWLKGNVIVSVKEATQGFSVTVQLTGYERTTVLGLLSKIVAEEHLLFDESVLIDRLQRNGESVLAAGDIHKLAFGFYLPASMPPSIHFDDQKSGTASVDYLLTARLDQHDVTVTKPVTVVGAPCHDIKEMTNVQEPSAIPLKSFGILDQGRFLVATKICNTHIAKGEQLKCSLSVRNESKIELERVDLQLVETVEWRANGHEKQQMTTIASLQDVTLPGSFTRPTTHPEHGKDIGPSTFAEMMAQLTWKRNWYDLKVPPCTLESYTGTLLTVKHALNVLVYLKGRLQHEIVATTADVQIFDEPLSGESGHLQNNHHIKAEASEEIARTKWPHDANAVAGNLETAPDVPTISEGATISMQT